GYQPLDGAPISIKPDGAAVSGLDRMARGEVACWLSHATEEMPALLPGAPSLCLLVALRSNEAFSGLIVVDNQPSGLPLRLEQAGPLLALASQVSTVVSNMRLREQERAESGRLALLLESAQALNSTLDSDQILRELAARLVTTLEAARVTFGHADRELRGFNVVAQQVGPGRPQVEPGRMVGAFDVYPILEQTLRSGSPFRGALGDPTLPAEEVAYLHAHALQEELIIPVVVRGEAIGLLEVQWDRPHTLGQEVVALCTSIASQAAVALGNAGLYASAAARAEQDALTGLLNHSTLLEYLDHAVATGDPFALLLIDIDNFKLFNDTYGHPVGDAVLTAVAGIVRAACREGDVAGRYGGDEMAVLLRQASAREAMAVARRLGEAVQGRPHLAASGAVIPISVSIGLACYPRQGATRQEMIAVADHEMYAAKRRSTRRVITRSRGGSSSYWQDLQLRDAADLLGDSPFGVLEGLVSAVDAKDRYTREHSEHVTQLALLLVDELNLPTEQRRVIAVAGLLHDVGKIGVPDRVLRKPGALAVEEYAAIKRHVSYGVAIIRGVLNDAAVVDTVAYHHERWDGQGYPHAIAGPETPILGRIMQVADAASAMLLDRPYRQGLAWEQVAIRLRQSAGSQFDPDLVEPFIAAFGRARARFAS
ncbi:MAG TPA: diguanylate cyclase, partial [Chloroflexota bacterium]|nr:diguanylate cyclase [Chloroflexota bacterium]